MPSRLPNLTRIGLLAVIPTVALTAGLVQSRQERDARGDTKPPKYVDPGDTDDRAAQLVDQAVCRLALAHSISGKLTQSVDMFGTHSDGSGVYLQQRIGDDVLFRLEMRAPMGEQTSGFLQVGDGTQVWTYQKLGDQEDLGRIDLLRLEEELQMQGRGPGQDDGGGLHQGSGFMGLLANLKASFRFRLVGVTRWNQVDAWKLVGRWRPEKLARLLRDEAEATEAGWVPKSEPLPEHLPDHVVLFIGQKDGFPYGIEYRRGGGREGGAGQGVEGRTIFRVVWHDVRLNVPIDPASFVFQPPIPPRDNTMAALHGIDSAD